MRVSFHKFLLTSAALIASTLHAAPVTVNSEFEGGIFGGFNVSYDTGAAGLKLQQVTVNLQSPLFLDPTFIPPGSLLPLPFSGASGVASTGFAGVSGVSDGATSFTLLFNDFDAGEIFSFNLDVDSPCNGFLCQLSGSLTSGSEFAGTQLITTFGGTGYNSTQLQGLYVRTGSDSAAASINGEVAPVPEPGTYALLAGGLVSMFLARRRSGSARNRA